MKKRIMLTTLSLIIVLASVVSAGSNQENKNETQDIKMSKKQFNSSIVTFNNLSLAIDFWHDASLKSDSKAIAEHTKMIHEIISEDIKSNYQAVTYTKLEASYSQKEYKDNKNNENDDFNKNKSVLKNKESILNAKRLLFASLQKSKSFAYSYRLLADYLQLLKVDIDANKIEIAGDASEIHEDAGQVRLLK